MILATHASATHPSALPLPPQVVRLQPRPAGMQGAPTGRAPGETAQVLPLFAARPLPAGPHAAVCFTLQDRIALMSWHASGSGYARLVVEDGHPGDAPDRGAFALAYRAGRAFACVGLTRTPAGIQAWRCSDGEVLGMHATMAQALAALPPG